MPKRTNKRGNKKSGSNKRNSKEPVTTPSSSSSTADAAVSTSSEVPFGAKARFIREQPIETPASLVISRAAEAGIPLSENHVYATRQKMKAEAAAGISKPSRSPLGKGSAKLGDNGSPSAVTSVDKKRLIETLESSIFRLGWDEAKQVFERMEREHYVSG